MKHLYLFTLEIVPLQVGRTYAELPSHLTLMSRFLSDLSPNELAGNVRSLFAKTAPVHLDFDQTVTLGPKKVTAHMFTSPDERQLHNDLRELLDTFKVEYQYPEFIGDKHKPHVTQRGDARFDQRQEHVASAAYLVEIVDGKRAVRTRLNLAAA